MEISHLLVLAVAILGYGLVSKRAERSVLTAPMVFIALGAAVGPAGFSLVDLKDSEMLLETLAELALIIILFSDASRIRWSDLLREHDLPIRLLGIGLPLTIALGLGAGYLLFPQLGWMQAAIIACILAPTDAALGQAVIANKRIPVRIRQALNVESGLNDGICLPLVLLFIALATHNTERGASDWLIFAGLQLGLGPLIGFLVGRVGGLAVEWAAKNGYMNESFQRLSALGLAMASFALAELAGGNGFMAAFFGGVGTKIEDEELEERMLALGEAEGQLLTLIIFGCFGAILLPEALEAATPRVVIYALLSLTLIRMLPVWISMLGTGLKPPSLLFLGWFGPRGLASILYMFLLAEGGEMSGISPVLVPIIVMTVLFSSGLHGLTAFPLGNAYARVCTERQGEAEAKTVSEMPTRLSSTSMS